MARFEPNVPIKTTEASVEVDAGLPVGRHRFRLEVSGASGGSSAPMDIVVEVVAQPVRGTTTTTTTPVATTTRVADIRPVINPDVVIRRPPTR